MLNTKLTFDTKCDLNFEMCGVNVPTYASLHADKYLTVNNMALSLFILEIRTTQTSGYGHPDNCKSLTLIMLLKSLISARGGFLIS